MSAKCFKLSGFLVGGYKADYRRRGQQCYARRRLRNRGVAEVTDLAMLLVGRTSVPVPGCLHGKQAHGKNQGNGQQSRG